MNWIWNWLNKKIAASIPQPESEVLIPGICECGHLRCCHTGGKGKCQVQYPPCEEHATWARCACQIFIWDDDDDDDPEPGPDSPDESAKEFERMFNPKIKK